MTTRHVVGYPAIEAPEVVVALRLTIDLHEDVPINDV
jgi:hypothetical protein